MKDVTGKTWTLTGNATLATGGKFGKCLSFPAGAQGYATTPGTQDFVMRTADFTLECWVKTPATETAEKYFMDFYAENGTDASWQLGHIGGLLAFTGAPNISVKATTRKVNDGSWHHIACVRKAGVLRLFVDGVKDGEGAVATDFSHLTNVFALGAQVARRNNKYDFVGFLDDVRIVKNLARYWDDFTPPGVLPDEAPEHELPSTAAFLRFDNSVIHDEVAANVWNSATDNGVLDTNEMISGVSSLTFTRFVKGGPKAADGPKIAPAKLPTLNATKPHTMELWFKMDATKVAAHNASGAGILPLFHQSNGGGNSDLMLSLNRTTHLPTFYDGPAGSVTHDGTGTAPTVGDWHHFAFEFDGTTARVFVDGVMSMKWPTTTGWRFGYTNELRIGIAYVDGYGEYASAFPGWIDDVRLVNGSKYGADATFTPERPVVTPPAGAPTWKQDFTADTFLDSDNVAWAQGSTAHNTNLSNQGRNNVAFFSGNNAGSYLFRAFTTDTWSMGTGDFTIEFMIRADAVNKQQAIIDARNGLGAWIGVMGGSTIGLSRDDPTSVTSATNAKAIEARTWYHVAFVRRNGLLRQFHNGKKVGEIASTTAFSAAPGKVAVGAASDGTLPYGGCVDNLRIYKGISKYWADFTIDPLTADLTPP